MMIHESILERWIGRNVPPVESAQPVLFVCTANICRSPMAERVFSKMAAASGHAVEMESAGTHDYGNLKPPFPMALATAKRRGYNLTRKVARQVRPSDFLRFGLILAMDRSNLADLLAISPPQCRSKVRLVMDFSARYRGEDVEDPYGGGFPGFEHALDMIEDAARGYVRQLVRVSPRVVAARLMHA